MRLSIAISVTALLLAGIAGQNSILQGIQADAPSSASAACAVAAPDCEDYPAAQGETVVVEYTVLEDSCPGADLHVLRYIAGEHGPAEPLVASWCS